MPVSGSALPGTPPPVAPDYNDTDDPGKNRWLLFRVGVKRTSYTDTVIARLDRYFGQSKLLAYVSSVLRNEKDQMRIIINYVKKYLGRTPAYGIADWAKENEGGDYVWQMDWSLLLSMQIIINPPLTARCLADYIKDGISRRGAIIFPSPHFGGKAFDIGGDDPDDPTIGNELKVINLAMADKKVGIKSITPERKNNCIHVNVY